MIEFSRPQLLKYGVAVFSVLAALLISLLLLPFIENTRSMFFVLAIVVSAWYGGLIPGLLSTALAVAALDYFLLAPTGTFSNGAVDITTLVIFAAVAGFITWLEGSRRHAEHATEHAKEQLEVILQGVADGITAQSPMGELIFANDAAAKIIGFPSHSELLKTPVSQIMSNFELLNDTGDPLPVTSLPTRQALQGVENAEMLVRFRVRATGQERWSLIKSKPVFDQQGKVRMAINIFQDITLLRSTIDSLFAEKERLRVTLASIGDAVIATNPQGSVDFMNPIAERITGWTEEAAIGKPVDEIFNIINEYTREKAANPIERALNEGIIVGLANHTVLLAKDGTEKMIDDSAAPIKDENGNIIGGILIFRDIGERRAAESELRRQALVFENSTDAILICDSLGSIIDCNPSAETIFGYSEAELLGKNPEFLNRPDEAKELTQKILAAFETEGRWVGSITFVRKDGTEAICETIILPIRDSEGHITTTLAVNRDITERRTAEEILRRQEREIAQSENQLRLITDKLPVLISYVDREGYYRFNNQTYTEWFGHTSDQIRGKHMSDVIGDEAYEVVKDYVALALAGQTVNYETTIPYRDAGIRDISVNYVPEVGDGGNVRGFYALVSDISDRKRVEKIDGFLAESSAILATSLDYEEMLPQVARAAVPYIADWVAVDLVNDEGKLRQLIMAHSDPEKERIVGELREKYLHGREYLDPAHMVVQTGQSILIDEINEAQIQSVPDEAMQAFIRSLNLRSMLYVPIKLRDTVLGVMSFSTEVGGRIFDSHDLAMTEKLASRAALVMENAQLYREAEQAREIAENTAERIARLQAVTVALSQAVTPQQVADVIVNPSITALDALATSVSLLKSDGVSLDLVGTSGSIPRQPPSGWTAYSLDLPIPISHSIKTGEALWFETAEDRLAAYPATAQFTNFTGAWVTLPLMVKGRAIGAISLQYAENRHFSDQERHFLLTLTDQCSQAMERASLYSMERQARNAAEVSATRISRLQSATASLSEALTSQQVVDVILNHTFSLLGAHVGSVYTLSDDHEYIDLLHHRGLPPETVKQYARVPVDYHIPLTDTIRTGEPVFLETLDEYRSKYPEIADTVQSRTRTQAVACFPLAVEGQVMGSISFSFPHPKPLTTDDHNLLLLLTQQCAQALDRARLYEAEQVARKDAEATAARIGLLQNVTAGLAKAITPQEVINATLNPAIMVLGTKVASVSLLHEADRTLEVIGAIGIPDEVQGKYQTYPLDSPFPIRDVILTGEPRWLETKAQRFRTYPATQDLDSEAGAWATLPLIVEERAIGAITFTFDDERAFTADEKNALLALVRQCAQALERARLYEAEQQARIQAELAEERLSFLAEASVVLASELDYEKTLRTVAHLAVPKMADWFTIDLIDEETRTVQQIAVEHQDPAKLEWAREINNRYPSRVDWDAPRGLYYVLRTGETDHYPFIPEELLIAGAQDEEHLKIIREVGFTSVMIVPLKVREKIVGAITFVSAEAGRHYDEDDVSLAHDLAQRTATAIENAGLYREATEQRERLRVTLASIGDAVIATDLAGRVTFVNPVAQTLTGWSQSEAAGKPLREIFNIVNHVTGEPAENPVEKVLQEGKIVGLANHTILISRDGHEYPIDDSGAPIRAEDGTMLGVIMVFRDITERMQAEAERQQLTITIQRQQEQLTTMLANVPGLVWEAYGQPDLANQRIDFVSEYIEAMLGYGVEEWINTPNFWLTIVHPEDRERAAAEAAAIFTGGAKGYSRFRWMHKDGTAVPVEAFSSVILDENGSPIGMRGVTMDTTERSRLEAQRQEAERALGLSEERFRLLFENAPVGISISREGNLIYVNGALARMFGYAHAADLLNTSLLEHITEQHRFGVGNLMEKRAQGESADVFEFIAERRDGSQFPIYIEVGNVTLLDGPATFAFVIDITERKRAEEALRENEERWRLVLENMPVMLSVNDEERRRIVWNREAERVTGYLTDEVVGNSNLSELMYPDEEYRQYIAVGRQENAGDYRNWELRTVCKDGSVKYIAWSNISKYHPVQGWADWALGIDITDRHRAEQRMKRLQSITAALSSAVTPARVAEIIISEAVPAIGAAAGLVVVYGEDNTTLEIMKSIGYSEEVVRNWQRFPVETKTAPLAVAVRTNEAVWLGSPQEMNEFSEDTILLTEENQHRAWAAIPLAVDENAIGAIGLSFTTLQTFSEEDRSYMQAIAQQCAQALERARLYDQARELAVLEERQRLARDLHDAVSQTLFSATIVAEALPRLWKRDSAKMPEKLMLLSQLTRGAMSEMRTLLLEMRPATLLNMSLGDLLRQLTDGVKGRKRAAITLEIDGDPTLPPDVHIALYRISQEALNNIIKHAYASQVNVRLAGDNERVELLINDDGRGFDPSQISSGLGLETMLERAQAIGANLQITSEAGEGTTIFLTWYQPAPELPASS